MKFLKSCGFPWPTPASLAHLKNTRNVFEAGKASTLFSVNVENFDASHGFLVPINCYTSTPHLYCHSILGGSGQQFFIVWMVGVSQSTLMGYVCEILAASKKRQQQVLRQQQLLKPNRTIQNQTEPNRINY